MVCHKLKNNLCGKILLVEILQPRNKDKYEVWGGVGLLLAIISVALATRWGLHHHQRRENAFLF